MKNVRILLITFLTGITSLTMSCNPTVKQNEQSVTSDEALEGKKVLYLYGGWEGHEPEQCRDLFVPGLSRKAPRSLSMTTSTATAIRR